MLKNVISFISYHQLLKYTASRMFSDTIYYLTTGVRYTDLLKR